MRKEIFLIFLLGVLFLSGCQSYYQKFERNGNSEITYTIDFTRMITQLASQSGKSTDEITKNISSSIAAACTNITQKDSSISCTVDGVKMVLKRSFAPGDYYTFSSEGGILYNIYNLTINKIPADKFSIGLESIGRAMGISEIKKQELIDLNAKEKNKLVATQMKSFTGFEIMYTVEMPGDITKAVAGSTEATINRTKATFNITKVMDDSAPLTVEARELNLTVLLSLCFVVVLAIVVIAFFLFKKK